MNLERESPAEPGYASGQAFVPAATDKSRTKVWSVLVRVLGAVGIVATLWLGLPFASGGTLALEEANAWLLAGTVLVVAVSFGYAVAESSLRDAALLLLLGFVLTWAVEAAGVRWGVPFGWPYQYHEALRPRLWGDVPLFIPFAWYVLLRVPAILLRRWNTGCATVEGRNRGQVFWKACACGLFMGGCSLLLEPLGVALGAWTWSRPGNFFGMPLLNAFGWALVGFLVHAAYFALERGHPIHEPLWLQRLEREVLAVCILFHGLAFIAVHNRLHSWLPTVFAVTAMAPLWVFWALSTWRSRGGGPCAETDR